MQCALVSSKDVNCYKCGQKGHYQNQCTSDNGGDGYSGGNSGRYNNNHGGSSGGGHRNNGGNAGQSRNAGGNRSSGRGRQNGGRNHQSMLAMALQTQTSATDWIVDSGATSHMTFQSPKQYSVSREAKNVLIADGGSVDVVGEGAVEIVLRNKSGNLGCTLEKVLYIPKLSVNLLSVHQICQSGKEVLFKGDRCMIFNGSEVIGQAVMRDGLYRLDTGVIECAAVPKPSGDLWHRRLGHLNSDYMRRINSIDRQLVVRQCLWHVC